MFNMSSIILHQGIRWSILRLMTFHLHRHARDSQIPILLVQDLFRLPIIMKMDIRVTSMKATNRHFQLPRLLFADTTNTMAALPSLMAFVRHFVCVCNCASEAKHETPAASLYD
ncbi:uncharacterized protein LOC125471634 [Pyrus x bretschneideri]|uniref:uncharacterized protein LOC125471634 n=1 Tax=Pyrus x bretschneideri TaxID=225117 RepID=UPI002030E1FD|nr:uncharacterized protein LOC125471634 [Pyrus x bretschneideri]